MYKGSHMRYTVEEIEARVAKINAKAEKFGVPTLRVFITESPDKVFVFEPTFVTWNRRDKTQVRPSDTTAICYDVEVVGDPVKLGDYTVIGKVELHLDKPVFLSFGEQEIRPLWDGTFNCEHCEHNRRRNSVFIIKSEKDGVKQVGSACVKDYTGLDISAVLHMTKLMKELDEIYEMDPKPHLYIPVRYFLALTIRDIREYGYKSRKDNPGTCTADAVLHSYSDPLHLIKPEDSHFKQADTVIAWVKENADQYTERSEFWYNLMTIAKEEVFDPKFAGYLAYLPVAYAKEMDKLDELKKRESNRAQSEYVGTVKERFETQVTVKRVAEFDTEYGLMRIIVLLDLDGNILVWKTSTGYDLANYYYDNLDSGLTHIFKIKATVKEHQEYKGAKQTAITRVVILG